MYCAIHFTLRPGYSLIHLQAEKGFHMSTATTTGTLLQTGCTKSAMHALPLRLSYLLTLKKTAASKRATLPRATAPVCGVVEEFNFDVDLDCGEVGSSLIPVDTDPCLDTGQGHSAETREHSAGKAMLAS